MEEYAPVLWMVVLFGFLLLSSLSKVRKKAERAAKRFGEHLPKEAWPTWDPTEEEAPAPREPMMIGTEPEEATAPRSVRTEETNHPQRADAACPEEAANPEGEVVAISGYCTPHEQAARPHPQRSAFDRDRRPAATQADNAPEKDTEGIAEDFDLRRAIIYSEILKPKYDE